MTPPRPSDPCFEVVERPALTGGRIRVVEVLATGTNGGAQEHLHSLVRRIDADALRRVGRGAVERQRGPQAPASRGSRSS